MRRRDLNRRHYATPGGPPEPDGGARLEMLGILFVLLLFAYVAFLASD